MPISEIKIDRSFITNMLTSQSSLNIVKTIVAIARSNDLHVVAEGVEERSQEELLQKLGCFTIQGYLYSKPVPMEQLMSEAVVETV
ncbi:diguanylate cyclase [Vibrio ponticus]|nr:diguanylate cyclase [Vibrio ponticus]